MKIIKIMESLSKSLSNKQKSDILSISDECIKIGATKKQLAPFYALCLLSVPTKITKKEEAHARMLGRKLKCLE